MDGEEKQSMDGEEKHSLDGEEEDNDLLADAYLYITTSAYPEGCTDIRKRIIWKKAKKFHVSDGELFFLFMAVTLMQLLDKWVGLSLCIRSRRGSCGMEW